MHHELIKESCGIQRGVIQHPQGCLLVVAAELIPVGVEDSLC
jgi:hypothetical protein